MYAAGRSPLPDWQACLDVLRGNENLPGRTSTTQQLLPYREQDFKQQSINQQPQVPAIILSQPANDHLHTRSPPEAPQLPECLTLRERNSLAQKKSAAERKSRQKLQVERSLALTAAVNSVCRHAVWAVFPGQTVTSRGSTCRFTAATG